MHRHNLLWISLLLGSAGCDAPASTSKGSSGSGEGFESSTGEETATTGETSTTGSAPNMEDVQSALVTSHALGSQLVADAETSAQWATQAVEFATVTTGGSTLVTTGTVRQTGDQYVYEPAPADVLVVELEGTPRATFRIHTMTGDMSRASAFLGGDHEFLYDVEVDGRMDITFGSARAGSTFETSAEGSMTLGGVELDIDVAAAGTHSSEVDTSGSHYENAFRTTGSVSGPGFDMAVDETWDFELITASGDGGGSAQSAVRTVANSLDLGPNTYDWVGVRTQKSYRDGRPSSLDTFWTAEGEVLRDGEPYGRVRLDTDLVGSESGGFILFMLDLPDESVELERIAAY